MEKGEGLTFSKNRARVKVENIKERRCSLKNSSSSTRPKTEDIQGVECQVCEKESFRIFTRKIVIASGMTAKIKCCPVCARVIDAAKETKNEQHYKTRAEQQEVSFQWANNLHGKKVIVFWQDGVPATQFNKLAAWEKPKPINQVQGTAYRTTNCSGGWGHVKVILDPAENKRITLIKGEYSFERELIPIIAGQRYGLPLYEMGDGNYYKLVTYGERGTIKTLDEIAKMQ